ncbi:MAG TPA: rhomboid family intramembrane serine protease [Spirochaetota bacterium]|nr:rhomboid family intramembrane serine protease [Spirochaetota bacterium]
METYTFTYGVIALTTVASLYALSNSTVFEKWLFSISAIVSGKDYLRLLTSILVHGNIGHLVFNMFSFYAFATGIEAVYGHKVIAYIYLYSALGGSILSLVMHRREPEYRAVGASGGVCGVIFSSIFLIPGGQIIVFPIPLPLPAWLYAILFVAFSLYGMKKAFGGIGHDAHLGGSLAGIVLAATISPYRVTSQPLLLAGILVPVIIFFIINKQNLITKS